MKKTLIGIVILAIIGFCAYSFLGNRTTQIPLPDLSGMGKITVMAREEGSGTKDAFCQLLGTTEAGANKIAMSTEAAISQTAEDSNAIAYAAYSSVTGAQGVKVLKIDGIEPDHDTITAGDYPLVRPYLIAYKGELSEVEFDLLAYIRGAGQKLVSQHITANRAPTTFLSSNASGSIKISGSSSVAPLMKELVAEYQTYNKNAQITVEVTDSTAGINSALRGECDLAMASRALKSYEAELLDTSVIGTDGVAVIVNSANPVVGLSLAQLRTIYDGKAANWTDLK